MKPTAHFLGLLLAALSVTALGADTPVAPATEPAPPAATTPAEPKKVEPAAVTPPALSLSNGPALSSPAVSPSNPSNGPALSPPAVSPLDSARGLSLSNGQSNPSNGPVTPPAAPVPFTPLANGKVDDKPADPDVLELPKMVVKQKPRPRLTPEIMVTKQAFGEQLAKQKYSALDQALNKWTMPLFGTSLAERALEDYEREKKEQLNSDVSNIAKALETADPAEAKSLKAAAARP